MKKLKLQPPTSSLLDQVETEKHHHHLSWLDEYWETEIQEKEKYACSRIVFLCFASLMATFSVSAFLFFHESI